ncbi:unnamed protein product [Callosobruchus maculatus]|uniref:DDE-1 domain-containing protein n=1 Tax=Callosobruchus maculatus TaxID=64391 RepID=A0A653DKB8_CALMS|nr:unnamed protein product [Callosobruchus maculatus]
MDQGVIQSLKSHYRRLLLKIVHFSDSGGEIFSINLLDGINFLHMAWQRVSKHTIFNCFQHGGFLN